VATKGDDVCLAATHRMAAVTYYDRDVNDIDGHDPMQIVH